MLANKTFSTSNITSTSTIFRKSTFERKQRNGKERQHVLQTKTDGNNGLLQSIQNTSFYFFLSLMWLEFISLMCFHHHHHHHPCRNVHILKPFCKAYFIWTKKKEIFVLLLQLCLRDTQWVDTFWCSCSCLNAEFFHL